MANPIVTNAISTGVGALISTAMRNAANKNAPKESDVTKETLKRLEALEHEIDKIEGQNQSVANSSVADQAPVPEPESGTASAHDESNVAVACVACAKAHLAFASGILKEAYRFATGPEGMQDQEVQRRILWAAQELLALEREDWSAEKVARATPEDKAVIYSTLPRIRDVRQKLLNKMETPADLEEAAVIMSDVSEEVFYASSATPGKEG